MEVLRLARELVTVARLVVKVDGDDLDEMVDVHGELVDYFADRTDTSGFSEEPNAEGDYESGIVLAGDTRRDVMDKQKIAGSLLRMARHLMEAREWTPVQKKVDVRMRNREMHDSLTSFAPALGKELKKRIANELNKQGFDVQPNNLNREWSQYLVYQDVDNNNNKYHYYAVYSFDGPNGETLYTAANCSGRIGIVERAYDLTKKFMRGPAASLARAVDAAEKHLRTKTGKGYEKVKMTRG